MKFSSAIAVVAVFAAFGFSSPSSKPVTTKVPNAESKIQVAILLDVSGSMDGLIEQAKAQLWNMVNTLGKAQAVNGVQPKIELALYEYGRTNNEAGKGYVKQLSAFTNDLDKVSQLLFSLNTDGGDEYCGQVIYTSLDELKWDASPDDYKVIFIAGNEDFLQGNVHYTQACTKANSKGVIVNTIYCGSYEMGIKEHWQLSGECGNGSFTNIDQNIKEPVIATPYDTTLITLNNRLNGTYVAFGAEGYKNELLQKTMDEANSSMGSGVAANRAEAKARGNVYFNGSWDLVDASRGDKDFFKKVDTKTLPDSLKKKTPEQLKIFIQQKDTERSAIQQEIITVANQRNKFISEEKARAAVNNNNVSLETAVEKVIKEQVSRFNLEIK